jgi:hypothetical protein
MPTAKKGYFVKDGTRVPGTTTVIGRYKESGALIHWAWKLGKSGVDYREVRDNAASAGTLAHEMVECYIRQREFDRSKHPPEIIAKAEKAYGAFLEWANSTHLKPIETEVALISEKHRFGGTLDAMLINDKLALGDWKTSNALYADYLLQLAAYGLLWEENFPDRPILGGFHLIRFDKEHGDFTHRWFAELTDAKEAFILMRQLYEYDYKLKKRAA